VSKTTQDEQSFSDALAREAGELASLKALDEWYQRRMHEFWEPFRREMLRRAEQGEDTRAELRDEIARRLGITDRARLLQHLYENAVGELVARAADGLAGPNTDAHREIVDRFDGAWRELANR
jgi:hypothetical protein